ncbi:PAAR domain-containing protein [Cupriavidus basilensis]
MWTVRSVGTNHYWIRSSQTYSGIIRVGDRTNHNGTVIEGFLDFTIDGVPVAGLGHLVECSRCGGTFPIIEGDISFTIGDAGTPVALHGMRTACGAVLISSVGDSPM